MPYRVENTEQDLILELEGGLPMRHAGDLGKTLASRLTSGALVIVRTSKLDTVDIGILQMLVSLRKTAGKFVLQDPSEAFVNAVDRCGLRRELLAGSEECP